MQRIKKFGLVAVGVVAAFLLARHAETAMGPVVPKDMPDDAHFVSVGYDVNVNEPTGQWIACREKTEELQDWCRVTDQKGSVVYEGNFLPVGSSTMLHNDELKIAAVSVKNMWITGPFEAAPVPVIPLVNGKFLVPAADHAALESRWARDPEELRRISSSLP